jgi:uncharacterized protein (DUF2147 family)
MRVSAQVRARLLCGAGLLFGLLGSASAAPGPAGEWMVAKGQAIIRIVDCGGQYWGVVAWEKDPSGTDAKNPNPALRSRSTLGMPILLGMRPSGQGAWNGQIYNAEDGRTYGGHISLQGPNTLSVQGCVLGFLCGGETWTRVGPPIPVSAAGSPAAKGTQPKSTAPQKTTGAVAPATKPAQKQAPGNANAQADAVGDICLLPDIARPTH